MDWRDASEAVFREYGKHGTHSGATKNGHLFSLGSRSIFVSNQGKVGDWDPAKDTVKVAAKPAPVEIPAVTKDGTSVAFHLLIKGHGAGTVHLVSEKPGALATACNPARPLFDGDVQRFDGSLDRVTCKVCGWVIEKQKRKAG